MSNNNNAYMKYPVISGEIKLSENWFTGKLPYNEDIFSLVSYGSVVEENISQERLFELLEGFYTPEESNFLIQVWYNGTWNNVL